MAQSNVAVEKKVKNMAENPAWGGRGRKRGRGAMVRMLVRVYTCICSGTHTPTWYLLRTLATKRPKAAPHSREGTKRPLGTEVPYVQHASRKYRTKNKANVMGLKVPARQGPT